MVQSSEAESSSSIEVHFGDREFDLSRPQGLIFLQPHRVRPWLLLYKYPADFGDEFVSGTSLVNSNLSSHRLGISKFPSLLVTDGGHVFGFKVRELCICDSWWPV